MSSGRNSRPSGWERLRAYSGTLHDQLESTPGGVFGRDADLLLHSGDRRWALPSREEMTASQVGDGKALLASPLQTGPVELVTVPLVYDNEGTGGRISVEGKLLNVIKDQAFDVVYAGSRAYSEHYVRQGNA